MVRSLGILLSPVLLLIFVSVGRAAQVPLLYEEERAPGSIGATVEHGLVYASVPDLADAFNIETQWLGSTQKLVLFVGHVQAKFTAWNPVVVVDDVPYNLPAQTIIRGGVLLAPAEPLARLLDPITPGHLTWDAAANAFRLSTADYNVRPGTVEQRQNGTMVTLRIQSDLPIEETTGEPNWLHLAILGGRIDAQGFRQMVLGGAVLQLLTFQYQNSAQISFRLQRGYTYDIMRSESGPWFRVLFRQVMPPPAPLSTQGEFIQINRDQWAINTIIIDPGHGGRDPGSVGPDDIYEKDIVLNIGLRLAERLRNDLNVNVVMTRSTDRFVSLRERGRVAVRSNGKLFISLHCNALGDPRIGGVQTYFLSDAETDEARDVARIENAALVFEDSTETLSAGECCDWYDVNEIVAGMTSDRYLRESQELAKLVQDEIVRSLGVRDQGVHQAGFYVMKGTLASMPSILVEAGYLSNPAEARRMRQRSYQRQVADAIYRAVREFKLKYEREM